MPEILATIMTIVATSLIAIHTIKQTLSNESGWRSKIFDVASKEYITFSEIYTMRTAHRYEKNNNPKMYSYDYLTNFAIDYCNYLISKRKFINDISKLEIKIEMNENNIKEEFGYIIEQELTFEEQEIIRVILRCMLKNHWDFNASMVPSIIKYKSNQNKNYKKHVHEAFCRIHELLKLNKKNNSILDCLKSNYFEEFNLNNVNGN